MIAPREETMSSKERVARAINLEEPDRVPVAPHLWTYTFMGLSTADMIRDVMKAEEAHRAAYEKFGGWDIVLPPLYPGFVPAAYYPHPLNAIFFNTRIPGVDASPWAQSCAEPVEDPPLMNEDGYDIIIDEGFMRFLSFRKLGLKSLFDSGLFNQDLRAKITSILEFWYARSVAMTVSHGFIPFEIFSHMRNLRNFLIDLHRRPDKIREASDATIDGFIELFKFLATPMKKYSDRIHLWCHRPPDAYPQRYFEELYFPYLKKMIDEFYAAGFKSQLHADGNWTSAFPYLRELPKQAVAWIELDGTSDIYKAKEILGDRMAIKGDVPATLFTLGSPHDMQKYCMRLIDAIAPGGGFILSSGCDTPPTLKPENLKMMLDTAKTYGVYR